ncbi:DUF2195 family protein, partial [Salmonella enterica]|uniref:DUF2195 family protein n=1 Tax=Salmonella enterica TaxID=28901 RepID=UPI003523A4BD
MKKYAVEVLFMSACAGMFLPVFAWGGTDVNIDNPLAECVDIHPVHRQEMDNLTILKSKRLVRTVLIFTESSDQLS